MHEERLLKLAELLETKVERKAFELWNYCDTSLEGKTGCGYVACAVGHAMRDPWFRRRGFTTGKSDSCLNTHVPFYKKTGSTHNEACQEFFEISIREFGDLFTSKGYEKDPTPKQVAKKIRKFVREGKRRVQKAIT